MIKLILVPVHSASLVDQKQIQKQILIITTDQMPDHTLSWE